MKQNMIMGILVITCLLALNACSKQEPTEQASIKEEAVIKENIIAEPVRAESIIEDGKKVKIHYVMKVDGNVLLDTHQSGPAEIVFGTDRLLRGIQEGIKGLKAGDQKQLILTPEEAYGFVNSAAIQKFHQNKIVGVDSQEQYPVDLQVGMVLDSQDQNGRK